MLIYFKRPGKSGSHVTIRFAGGEEEDFRAIEASFSKIKARRSQHLVLAPFMAHNALFANCASNSSHRGERKNAKGQIDEQEEEEDRSPRVKGKGWWRREKKEERRRRRRRRRKEGEAVAEKETKKSTGQMNPDAFSAARRRRFCKRAQS